MYSKFPVTDKALKTIGTVMQEQDNYGFDKYGKPLNPKDQYDWMAMFLQEMADGLKYIQCEMERKNDIIHVLKMGMRSDVPRIYRTCSGSADNTGHW